MQIMTSKTTIEESFESVSFSILGFFDKSYITLFQVPETFFQEDFLQLL